VSIATQRKRAWDTREYRRIVAAEYDAPDLVVLFEDRARVRAPVDQLIDPARFAANWEAMTFNEDEVIVPTDKGQIELPWLPIRSLTDPAFDAYLAAAAVASQKLIGQHIGAFREGAGLSVEQLAERSGEPVRTVTRVEDGDHEVVLPLLERILQAMGHELGDLATSPGERLVVPGYETP